MYYLNSQLKGPFGFAPDRVPTSFATSSGSIWQFKYLNSSRLDQMSSIRMEHIWATQSGLVPLEVHLDAKSSHSTLSTTTNHLPKRQEINHRLPPQYFLLKRSPLKVLAGRCKLLVAKLVKKNAKHCNDTLVLMSNSIHTTCVAAIICPVYSTSVLHTATDCLFRTLPCHRTHGHEYEGGDGWTRVVGVLPPTGVSSYRRTELAWRGCNRREGLSSPEGIVTRLGVLSNALRWSALETELLLTHSRPSLGGSVPSSALTRPKATDLR